jgi:hypothetical protein
VSGYELCIRDIDAPVMVDIGLGINDGIARRAYLASASPRAADDRDISMIDNSVTGYVEWPRCLW